MKKNILNSSVVALSLIATLFTGCNQKGDILAPTVTLNGFSSQIVSLQGNYNELGATAVDDQDGTITTVISGNINKDLAGIYLLTYTATDAAGNSGTATRTVTVRNDAWALAGMYSVTENYNGSSNMFQQTITASSTINNILNTNRFGNLDNNTVNLTVSGVAVNILSQTIDNVGSGTGACDIHSRQTDGTGIMTSATAFNITYNDSKIAPCTGSRTGVVAAFTKQ
jgi:hypothetical protein